jgi:hypothetical protein
MMRTDAITAMHNQDSELAKRVIDGDKQVNMMEVAIDEKLLLHQPPHGHHLGADILQFSVELAGNMFVKI